MDSIGSQRPASEPHLTPQKAALNESGDAAQIKRPDVDQHAVALRNELLPDKLLVRLDAEAQRFVQTLTDPNTEETVRRYPSEAQLAYSRAVMAYLRALES